MIRYIDDITIIDETTRPKAKGKRLDKQNRKAEASYRKARKNRRIF